jgi:exodeoxyribonuclease VII small subunit
MAEDKAGEPTFEEALKRLEAAVAGLEEGNLALSAALRLFEEGLEASNLCRARLEEAKQKVEVLEAENGGNFRLTELDMNEEG